MIDTILGLFKSADSQAEMRDKNEINRQYRYWRIRIFYAMYVGYIFYYFTRNSFNCIMPMMIVDMGFTKTQVGILGTVLSMAYGFSKFVSGALSDRSNPRFFMGAGLIVTGIINIFFGMSSSILVFAILWGLNGWFQGFGWPPCSRLLTHWYSKSERGMWWSLWSTSHNLGAAAAIYLVTWSAKYFGGWRYGLYVPGVICIFMGFFLINRLRDTPESLGLPSIEKHKGDLAAGEIDPEDKKLPFKELFFNYVLKNPYIWVLAFASLFIYVIRMAMNTWTTLYLIETKGYSLLCANTCVFLFEIGGFIGMLVAGFLSDSVFKARRGPVNVIFAVGIMLSFLAFWLYPGHYFLWDYLLTFVIGFFLFGPQMLIGLAAAELAHKKAAGTATGLTGWFAYIGSATSGAPLGSIAEHWGWNGYFMAVFICCIVSCLLLLP